MRTVLMALALTACGGTTIEPAEGVPSAPAAPNDPYVPTDAHESVLAAADAHDGTVDHVVSDCASCGLGMPGDAAHAVRVGEYQVHMCSDSCKTLFEDGTGETLDRIGELVN
jgi:hypothetical protein